ncbi:MAG: MotA/TolQ/ExbB proton channel family protein [Alphaproteobacteria bacterium]|jgi:biopolymer transport protein ExbB|nr:MotA/TolQ/ExbB proton channel family protein [Alphaproteobacteria bacterium]MDE1987954.1 MotA/TolQ/ExbB proton channel family protein [Alphaproteobacteria bacterium]MDE2164147.1 MotA/TolQ/ExbB proton channel family protein [Alphaproteobacteria bacterium]MDE2265991.1 MotA/TolQ/ExbB proton channel family protein [Alphaproteobacteria bacterium]MDE2499788.1 MotA/TolQ/ExbB proton channel family protein [Alphaproteobacteria bacterium]
MISKHLTIAAAFVLLTGFAVAPAMAQATAPAPAANTMAAPAAAPAAPADAGPTVIKAPTATAPEENPYGLGDILAKKNPVSYAVLAILLVMSIGTWYIFFVKFFDQSRILGQARTVERRFWTSGTLNEGIEKLPKNSMFRLIAEAGVRASSGGTTLINLNDWIAMSLTRQLEDATGRLQGGIAFLASVGSTAPFVGLFGTVWGILQALIAIGVAGQASIGKVAGPVGEALIMTALGLAAAVPAVLLYNLLVRRNKVITDKLRGFAGDLQTYMISKGK